MNCHYLRATSSVVRSKSRGRRWEIIRVEGLNTSGAPSRSVVCGVTDECISLLFDALSGEDYRPAT